MPDVTTKRFSLAEYHRLTELGFLSASDRVELIRGELVQIVIHLVIAALPESGLLTELEAETEIY